MTLLLAFVCFLGAVALLGRASLAKEETGLARSLRALEEVTASPQELAEEAEVPFRERVLEPLHERALSVGRRITGADQAERIRKKLDLAGNPAGWSIDRVIGFKVLAAVAVPLIAVAYAALVGLSLSIVLLAGLVGAAVGFLGPDLYLYQIAFKRSEEIRRTLADTVDLLTISVEAGLGFDAALQHVATKTDGPLAEEFSRVLREIQIGQGRSAALRALGERTNVTELQTFVGSMVQADALGIPIAQVLRVQSGEMRIKRRQYAEKRAQQVPVKIMVPLVVCILPCLMVVVMGPAILSILDLFAT